ncbi:MAG: hypothetical protein LBR61_10020 [Synergistaceae bacterium]|jgi:muconate cycloisomerase|nr:hypothetical protein [Synergistaceae bacterium]
MSRIKKCEVQIIKRPTVVMTTSYGVPPQEKEHVILSIEDEEGNRGWGESTPLPEFSGETAQNVALILKTEILPGIMGMDSFNIAAAHHRMDRLIFGNHASKMAVDGALYDLNAKNLKIPLYRLLGGKMRDEVPINRHIGIVSLDEAVKKAEKYLEDGYRSVKMKIGSDVDADAKRVQAVRKVLRPDVALRVDANGGYSFTDAFSFIRQVESCGLEMYEQLLPSWDLDGIAEIRRSTGVPVCIDEGIFSPHDALVSAEKYAADFFTLKLVKTGGIYKALQIAGVAEAAGIRCVVANTFDTQINCSACLHLACALPSATVPHDLTCFATQPTLADTCHTLEKGLLRVGDEPGTGVRSLAEFSL